MTVALFDTAQVGAVADAIRAKTGKTALMTVGEMPDEIASISACTITEKEVWLHCPDQLKGAEMVIDTGAKPAIDQTLEIIGYGNLYSTSCLFSSVTSASSRQGVDLLTTSNRVRYVWGNSGLQTLTIDITTLSAWMPMKITLNQSGVTFDGYTSGYVSSQLTGDFGGVTPTNPSTENYKIFGRIATSGDYAPGVFRSAKIFDGSNNLIHHFVPILKSDWSLVLRDKVTGTEQALATGANGYEAFWQPYADGMVDVVS